MNDTVLDDRPQAELDAESPQETDSARSQQEEQKSGLDSAVFETGAKLAADFLQSFGENSAAIGETLSDGISVVQEALFGSDNPEPGAEQESAIAGVGLSDAGQVLSILTKPMETLAKLGGNLITAFDWMFDSILDSAFDAASEQPRDQKSSQEMRQKLFEIAGEEVANAYDQLQEACKNGDQQAIENAKEKLQSLIKELPEDRRDKLIKALEKSADSLEDKSMKSALRGMVRVLHHYYRNLTKSKSERIEVKSNLPNQQEQVPPLDAGSGRLETARDVFDQFIPPAAYKRYLMRQENSPDWAKMISEVCEAMAEAARRADQREQREASQDQEKLKDFENGMDILADQIEAVVEGAERSAILDQYTEESTSFMPEIKISKDSLQNLVEAELEYAEKADGPDEKKPNEQNKES